MSNMSIVLVQYVQYVEYVEYVQCVQYVQLHCDISKKALCIHKIVYLALRALFLEFFVMRGAVALSSVSTEADILAVVVFAAPLLPPPGPA